MAPGVGHLTRRSIAVMVLGVALGAAALVVAPLGAQELSIAAFFGHWKGSGISESELSVYFRLTARDLDVVIRPEGAGFNVAWTTVQRQKGDPDNPDVVRKSSSLSFIPSGRPGIWRATTSADPLTGGTLAWARVKGHTLTVNSLVIDDGGGHEMQIYKRTLSDLGMALEFTRLKEGEPVRTAKGRLIKLAD